jgi:hypothetical protein
MILRYRLQKTGEKVIDAVFFKGDHDFSRDEEPGVRYTLELTDLDALDNPDREQVAFLILKQWYPHVVATRDLDGYMRGEGQKKYEAAVYSMADSIVSYAMELLMENRRFTDFEREGVIQRFNEEIDVAFGRLDPLVVLQHTDNEDALTMHGMDLSKENPVQDLAYWAFYEDVMDEVLSRIDLNKPDLGLADQHAVDGD